VRYLPATTEQRDRAGGHTAVNAVAHANFPYKGVFDMTGLWYANDHHSRGKLAAGGTGREPVIRTRRRTALSPFRPSAVPPRREMTPTYAGAGERGFVLRPFLAPFFELFDMKA
jgi:hypothetical protein